MTKILAKISPPLEGPRGPDVVHRVGVRREWLREGASIRFELPRNLTCAICDGGGCDACERAGAVSLRGRQDPPEQIDVTLPKLDEEPPSSLVIRIPDQGGHALSNAGVARGILLLKVSIEEREDSRVLRVETAEPANMPEPKKPTGGRKSWIIAGIWLVMIGLLIFAYLRAIKPVQ